MGKSVTNFGRNLRFTPGHVFAPRDEAELLRILDEQRGHSIRAVASRHSWSDGIVTPDVLIDLRHLRQVETMQDSHGETWATIGGGCQIKHVLSALYNQANVTLPAIGLIAEQTIAGATATGTHGSGRHSLSHYLAEVRVATYDRQTGRACIRTIAAGDELRAIRCSLGCLGIVVSVRLRCVAPYQVTEVVVRCDTVAEALAMEEETPLQQFYLIPHSWQVFVQRRAVAPAGSGRSWHATFYRLYWRLGLDITYHLGGHLPGDNSAQRLRDPVLLSLALSAAHHHRLERDGPERQESADGTRVIPPLGTGILRPPAARGSSSRSGPRSCRSVCRDNAGCFHGAARTTRRARTPRTSPAEKGDLHAALCHLRP